MKNLKNIENMTNIRLEKVIEEKREELNRLYSEYGLNDFTLKKSQELDILIVKAQREKLLNGENSEKILA